MIKRLMWKEWRTFGPLWATVLLMACLLQVFLLATGGEEVRQGSLYWLAMLWSVIYACTAAAAAFAAEREVHTLSLLDAMGVDRPHLWTGKLLFSSLSTLFLALALLGFAATGSTVDPLSSTRWDVVASGVLLLVESICWGLLWSAFCSTALRAAVGTIASLTMILLCLGGVASLDQQYLNNSFVLFRGSTFLFLTIVAATTLGLSWYLMNRTPTERPSMFSSDESDGAAWLAAYPMADQSRWRSTGRSIRWQSWREGRWTLVGIVGLVLSMPLLHYYFDWREGDMRGVLALLCLIAALSTGIATFEAENRGRTYRFLAHQGVRPWWVWFNKIRLWLAVLVGFIAVAMLYGSIITFRSSLASPWALATHLTGLPEADRSLLIQSIVAAMVAILAIFSIGQLLAMVIPRGITAWLCALMLLLPCVAFPAALFVTRMATIWIVLPIPFIFLGASLVWSRDWLEGRRDFRSWSKLAALVLVPSICLKVYYTIERATGVPDIGPQPTSAALIATRIPDQANAAVSYREAYKAWLSLPDKNAGAGAGMGLMMMTDEPETPSDNKKAPGAVGPVAEAEAMRQEAEVVASFHQAAAMPLAQFQPVTALPAVRNQDFHEIEGLQALILGDFTARLERKDFDAAWADVRTLFQMAGHLGQTTPDQFQFAEAIRFHEAACQSALDWTLAPGQTVARVKAALSDFSTLPDPPSAVVALETEAASQELLFALPKEEFRENLITSGYIGRPTDRSFFRTLEIASLTFSWERERARRTERLMNAAALAEAGREPYQRAFNAEQWRHPYGVLLAGQRPMPGQPDPQVLEHAFTSTPLTRYLNFNGRHLINQADLELNGRRMLITAMALQAWRLGHSGSLPPSMDLLVPEILTELPTDPFSGYPYQVAYRGKIIPDPTIQPINQNQNQNRIEFVTSEYYPPGRLVGQYPQGGPDRPYSESQDNPLIIGFGPNRTWNGGMMKSNWLQSDIVLVLPKYVTEETPKTNESNK